MIFVRRLARTLVLGIAVPYGLVCLFVWFTQEDMLFPGRPVPVDHVYPHLVGAEDIWITRPDGARLHVAALKRPEAVGVMLYFHGNGGNNVYLGSIAGIYGPRGYEVYGLDYRGFGKSTGDRSEAAMLADALAFYDAVVPAGAPPPLIMAHSLGSPLAAYVASQRPAQRLVLYAPPGSIAHVANLHYPWLPGFLLRYPLRTDHYVPQVAAPVLIFHGTDDKVVPLESGEHLRPLLKPGDVFHTISGGRHNDLPWRPDVMQLLNKELASS